MQSSQLFRLLSGLIEIFPFMDDLISNSFLIFISIKFSNIRNNNLSNKKMKNDTLNFWECWRLKVNLIYPKKFEDTLKLYRMLLILYNRYIQIYF